MPHVTAQWLEGWRGRSCRDPFSEQRLRDGWVAQDFALVTRGLKIVVILIQVLPLLGLLGTVSGMI